MKISDITDRISSRLAKRLTLVFTGNISSAGLGFLAVLLISRSLSVDDFGLFNMARSVLLVGSLFCSLGLDVGMIRFASYCLKEGRPDEAAGVFKAVFFVIAISGALVALIVFAAAGQLSSRIFHNPDLAPLIRLVSVGILGLSVFECLRAVFYSYQLFRESVILQLSADVFKLVGVIVLLWYLTAGVSAAVAVLAVSPLFGVLIGFGLLRDKIFPKGNGAQNLLRKLFSYGKWLFASNVCNTIFKYVSIFMLAGMLNSKAAGIYGLALNLAYIFPILMDSLKSVLLPEVSRIRETEQFERYIKGSLKISFLVIPAVVPFLFVSDRLIPFLFGPRYSESVVIFNFLMLAYTVQIAGSTIRMVLYAINKPRTVAVSDFVRLVLMCLGCYLMIPHFGTVAPAVVAFLLNVGIVAFLYSYFLRQIRRKDLTPDEELAVERYSG